VLSGCTISTAIGFCEEVCDIDRSESAIRNDGNYLQEQEQKQKGGVSGVNEKKD
jgi:hypothetical protein